MYSYFPTQKTRNQVSLPGLTDGFYKFQFYNLNQYNYE
jgi:hypothetical protein